MWCWCYRGYRVLLKVERPAVWIQIQGQCDQIWRKIEKSLRGSVTRFGEILPFWQNQKVSEGLISIWKMFTPTLVKLSCYLHVFMPLGIFSCYWPYVHAIGHILIVHNGQNVKPINLFTLCKGKYKKLPLIFALTTCLSAQEILFKMYFQPNRQVGRQVGRQLVKAKRTALKYVKIKIKQNLNLFVMPKSSPEMCPKMLTP